MTASRKIFRAFLASPGDLQEEREAIRHVVTEFNETWPDQLGYQVELLGWEETISGFGRPQHLINQDVDRCDLFLGMIWKRWGTPPDTHGRYTSGFHEEFERSVERRKKAGKPEISLFFKEIDEEFMLDQGPDLKKVLQFKKTIIAEKAIFFQSFKTIRDIESLIRKCISRYVTQIKNKENLEAQEDFSKQTKTDNNEEPADRNMEDSPLSPEGFSFLKMFMEKIRNPDGLENLTETDIARFRLLANSIGKPGNDDKPLGVHDINILFANRNELNLGTMELYSLIRLALKNLDNENVPLWYWYSQRNCDSLDMALYSFASKNDDEKFGAIRVLTLLRLELPDQESLERKLVIDHWFSEESSARVKNAALDYLAKCGNIADFQNANVEYERNDSATSRNALECMISILYRAGKQGAAEHLILEKQFGTLDMSVLKSVLERFGNLDTNQLLTGLEHRNSEVRLRTLRALSARNALTTEVVEKTVKDSDAKIRFEALRILVNRGQKFSKEKAQSILVQPQTQLPMFSFGGLPNDDGKEYFKEFQIASLHELGEKELLNLVDKALIYDDLAYFVLAKKYFSKYQGQLRTNIDNKFKDFFHRGLAPFKKVANIQQIEDLVKSVEDLEDVYRKQLTRRGLDILCRKRKQEDINRLRENLKTGYAGVSVLDAEYFEKNGEWADIELLVNAEDRRIGHTLLSIGGDEGFQDTVAKVLYKIGKHSISDLLLMKLPPKVIQKILGFCSESTFRNISDKTLFELLDNEADYVRKAASMLAVRSFTTKRIKTILDQYVVGGKHRYYNVIHWLDLGVSMTRSESKRVVMASSR